MRRVLSALLAAALVVLVWAVPVAIGTLVEPARSERSQLELPLGDLKETAVGSRADDGRQSAQLNLEWGTKDPIVWMGETGIVTEVYFRSGDTLEDGIPLLKVDDRTSYAQTTGQPLFRDVDRVSSPGSAQWLDQHLQRLGVAQDTTLDDRGRTSWMTTEALIDLQKTDGTIEPDGVFRQSQAIFVGDEGSIAPSVSVGDQVAQGDKIYETAPSIISSSLSFESDASRQALLSGQSLIVEWNGVRAVVSGSELDGPNDLDELFDIASPEDTQIDGVVVSLVDPIIVGSVASSAVVLDQSNGLACVLRRSGEPLIVEENILSSFEPGVSYVQSDLIGELVVGNPSISLTSYSCA